MLGVTIWSARLSGSTWSTPVTIADATRGGEAPQVVVDSTGVATAVWANVMQREVETARFVEGSWTATVMLSATGVQTQTPQLAVDADRRVTALWLSRGGNSNHRVQTRRLHGAVWNDTTTISTDSLANAFEARLAVNRAGAAVSLWATFDGMTAKIVAARAGSDAAWGQPVTFPTTGWDVSAPRIAVDDSGMATAVWRGTNMGAPAVIRAARAAGGTWSDPVTLSTAGANADSPEIAVDPTGVVTAVWVRPKPGGTNLVVQSSRFVGQTWTTPINLSADGRDAGAPMVTVDPAGVVTATWIRSNGQNTIVQAARFEDGAWGEPVNLSPVGRNAGTSPDYPWTLGSRVLAGTSGAVIAIWSRHSDTAAVIEALTLRGPPHPPTSVAAQTGTHSATISWTPPAMDGGAQITSYTATATPDGATCSATAPDRTCTLTGLAETVPYSVTVTARNAVGTSTPSAPVAVLLTRSPSPAPAPTGAPIQTPLPVRALAVRVTTSPAGTVRTTGAVPRTASRVTQTATAGRRTVNGRCTIAPRTGARKFTCTLRLTKGRWAVRTRAMAGTTVVAQTTRTITRR